MLHSRNPIPITIWYSDQEYKLNTYRNEYRDLRALIMDKLFLEDFGQCGGMGRCATCIVEIEGLSSHVDQFQRNELTTLKRNNLEHGKVRLSCQVEINDELANAVVRVRDYV